MKKVIVLMIILMGIISPVKASDLETSWGNLLQLAGYGEEVPDFIAQEYGMQTMFTTYFYNPKDNKKAEIDAILEALPEDSLIYTLDRKESDLDLKVRVYAVSGDKGNQVLMYQEVKYSRSPSEISIQYGTCNNWQLEQMKKGEIKFMPRM